MFVAIIFLNKSRQKMLESCHSETKRSPNDNILRAHLKTEASVFEFEHLYLNINQIVFSRYIYLYIWRSSSFLYLSSIVHMENQQKKVIGSRDIFMINYLIWLTLLTYRNGRVEIKWKWVTELPDMAVTKVRSSNQCESRMN